jgi:shikimate dehydrogenase
VDGKTRLFGILGHPVASSLSPAMQNAAFQALHINAVYVPFPVSPEDLPQVVRGLAAAGVAGFNLTVPHKRAILPLLEEITPEAEAIGAVNTVRCEAGRMAGTNTDGQGFLLSLTLDLGWMPAGKSVLLLGAGGAARAIAMGLLEKGCASLLIANRTPERAEALAEDCRARFPKAEVRAGGPEAAQGSAPHLLVNSTTVGMGDGAAPVNLEQAGVREAVCDIVYSPPETPLLKQAARLGLPRTNGIGMLLYQGTLAFEYWTGRGAPVEVMRAALEAGLAARES